MNSDLQQLIELFDAKVQSFEAPAERRFHVLLPFKEGIIRLREKNASSRTTRVTSRSPAMSKAPPPSVAVAKLTFAKQAAELIQELRRFPDAARRGHWLFFLFITLTALAAGIAIGKYVL